MFRLTASAADRAHAVAWDDAVIVRFGSRKARVMALGFADDDADDLAERLHLCDLLGDRRARCVECAHLGGHVDWLHCTTDMTPTITTLDAARPRCCAGFTPLEDQ